jgi:hypothetical protein
MAIVSRVDYGSAEVRGQLRQWKKKLARGYADFDAAYRRLQAVETPGGTATRRPAQFANPNSPL